MSCKKKKKKKKKKKRARGLAVSIKHWTSKIQEKKKSAKCVLLMKASPPLPITFDIDNNKMLPGLPRYCLVHQTISHPEAHKG